MFFTPDKLEGMFPTPQPSDSKYTRGVVGLMTGTDEYPGAGVLSVCAAAMCGAGYVRASLPREARLAVLMAQPEVVLSATSWHTPDVWVIGSGFSGLTDDDERSREVRRVLELTAQRDWYVVVDAGALETFATLRCDILTAAARSRCVITPHTGEAARIFTVLGMDVKRESIEEDREKYAVILAEKLQCTVVLKGAPTVVADPLGISYVLPPATHWLATAGTGDVLAGIMGGVIALNSKRLRAEQVSFADVVAGAVIVHSYAAGIAAHDIESIAQWSGSAFSEQSQPMHFALTDMISYIPQAMSKLSQLQEETAGKN